MTVRRCGVVDILTDTSGWSYPTIPQHTTRLRGLRRGEDLCSCVQRLTSIIDVRLFINGVDLCEPTYRVTDCPRRKQCFLSDLFLCERSLVLKNPENELRAWREVTKLLVSTVTHYPNTTPAESKEVSQEQITAQTGQIFPGHSYVPLKEDRRYYAPR